MLKKVSVLICAAVLGMAANVWAADKDWTNGGGDRLWRTSSNWSGGTPTSSDKAAVRNNYATNGPIIDSSTTAAANTVVVGDWSSTSGDSLDMTGGTLTTNSWFVLGYGPLANHGTFTISAGTVNVNDPTGGLYVGNTGVSIGTLNMTGGTINVTATFGIAQVSGSTGTVNLHGGTINCGALNMTTNGRLDITTGRLIINSNVDTTIGTYISSGWITASGGGTIHHDYNITNPGKTTVWVTSGPTKAANPNPANSATNIAKNATLSWTAGAGAASHDVYFGTNSIDVSSAGLLPGDLDRNGIVNWDDAVILTESWLLDPTGTEPCAGVNGDDTVDLADYALLAENWTSSIGSVFKGNQDANSVEPGTLAFDTTYYWRVDEVNGCNTIKGDVWSFRTQSDKATNPSPSNGATSVGVNPTLSWTAGAGTPSHDVYFGTANPPASIGNQSGTTYTPGTLAFNTTYYWRIDEVGGSGTVTGDLWSFTTGSNYYTIVQASDPQMGWGQCGNMDYLWGTTISKINIINPAFVIVTGDLINTSSSNTQAATYKSYAAGINSWIPIYTLPGNHDIGEPSSQTKYDWWLANLANPVPVTNPWYSFTYGNDIFICLDSGVFRTDWGGKQATEIAWLTQTLQDANAAGYAHKFVFMHISLCLNSVDEAYMGSTGFNLPIAIRQQLLSLFHQYNVTAVFQGHYHLNAYVNDNGLEIVTTSSCTCGLGNPPTIPGIRIINVYPDHIEHTYRYLSDLP
jgi:hypothetical protein